jgi:hypothetical protein
MHEAAAAQLAPAAEDLPCADDAFLAPLKGSAEFGMIRSRLVSDHYGDSWQEDGFHFFVFQLKPADSTMNGHATTGPPVTVFVMHADQQEPISAIVVTPLPDGQEAEIEDLRTPDSAYHAPMA